MIVKNNVSGNENYNYPGGILGIKTISHVKWGGSHIKKHFPGVFPSLVKSCIDFFFRDRYKLQPQKMYPLFHVTLRISL